MARVRELGADNDDNPILQVWRQAEDGAKIYDKISKTTLILQSSYPGNGNDSYFCW